MANNQSLPGVRDATHKLAPFLLTPRSRGTKISTDKVLCFVWCCLTWVIHQYFKVPVGVKTPRAPFTSSLVREIHATCWRTLLSIWHQVLSHYVKFDIEVDVSRLLQRRKLNAIQENLSVFNEVAKGICNWFDFALFCSLIDLKIFFFCSSLRFTRFLN